MSGDLRVAIRPYARVVAFAGAFASFWALLASFGLVGFAAELLPQGPDQNIAAGYALLGAGVAGTIVAGGSLWTKVRATFVRRAWLRVHDDRIEIDHRGLFVTPPVIERSQVAVVSFDDRPSRRIGRDEVRFEIEPDPEGKRPSHLFSRRDGAPVPLLSAAKTTPNLLLLFREPIRLKRSRRYLNPLPTKAPIHPPLAGRPARGLLVRVRDVGAAAAAFEPWGVLRSVRPEDLEAVAPDPEPSRRERKRPVLENGVVAAIVLGQVGLPFLFREEGRGFGTPSSETLSAVSRICTEGSPDPLPDAPAFRPDSASLGALLPEDPGGGMHLFFDSPLDVGDAARFSSPEGVAGWTEGLLDHRFESGYLRRWSAEGKVVFASVWRFASAENARRFERFARNEYCRYLQDAFMVSGVDAAVGMTVFYDTGAAYDQVTFLRGSHRFLIGLETPEPQVDHELVSELAREVESELD